MTANPSTHPRPDQLAAFGLGKLQPHDVATIEAHLEACPACCDTLVGLTDAAEDTFVALVRKSANLPSLGDAMSEVATVGLPWSDASLLAALPRELADHPRYRIIGPIGRG